ncbi:MAG: hypothetical protein F6K50_30500 [Moorea sp. SIO3I7]|uniref:hypothetical protein n=1 Tax=unclassified Moorena TaxID=2683338 RepID=UPI0013CBE3FF|nr:MULTISPECIES: hypothetical protein [unclassified Moorena]NEN99652.1 hypothetical protein [Moorena sp. SIO3I7]NEO47565.1 hypothetical protein [Moorena sp. SIO4A3]NEO16276.1 hypothetical protein [Moorena sp. SIO3E8]NEO24111.1 hypothetical protein [Moorena sp. SIO4A5]NEP28002.1 hypothetical protein [Moorena sp. SIO3I6]
MSQSFNLERVTFYGRSLAEYSKMFLLDFSDWVGKSILDCPGGPASFGREARALGIEVCAVDPQYVNDPDRLLEIASRDIDYVVAKISQTSQQRKWDYYQSLEDLRNRQVEILDSFIEDYRNYWQSQEKYITASLPHLPFEDNTFDLATSGHLLFSFQAHFPKTFTIDSLLELARVARDVRVFPLRANEQDRSKPFAYFEEIISSLQQQGLTVEVKTSEFEFQVGANQVMIIRRI